MMGTLNLTNSLIHDADKRTRSSVYMTQPKYIPLINVKNCKFKT